MRSTSKVPVGSMAFLNVLIIWLCFVNRPHALAYLTVYMIHHAYVYLFHVTAFSLVGQLKIRLMMLACSNINIRERIMKIYCIESGRRPN